MTEMGKLREMRNSKHSATELAATMKSQANRLAVVLQPSLLCWGKDQLFVTKTNGKATEVKSVCTLHVTGGVNSIRYSFFSY